MILRFLGGLGELVHDVLWGSEVGVSHSEVNDVLSGVSGINFNLVDGCKYIRWETIEPGKSFNKNNLFKINGVKISTHVVLLRHFGISRFTNSRS